MAAFKMENSTEKWPFQSKFAVFTPNVQLSNWCLTDISVTGV